MKLKKYRLIFTALAALALLATACSKIDDAAEENGYNSATGTTVSVTLPIGIAEQETTAATSRTTAMPATSRTTATNSPEEGLTVSFGEAMGTTDATPRENRAAEANTDAPSTRTIAQTLSNVWVLQFDNAGKNISTTYVGTLSSGAYLSTTLTSGTGQTIYIIANGPARGTLTTTNTPKLDYFESTMLHKTPVTNAAPPPLSGKLTGVTVTNTGNGTGKISLADATLPIVVMRRIHAEVTLTVDCNVTDYTLTGAQLYNAPVGAVYGWNNATTTFPNNTNVVNFNYIDMTQPGMTPTSSTSGTKPTYKWFIGDNRRGDVAAGITAQTDRHSGKAPAYSTFARVILTNSTDASKKIYYDIYLGSGDVKNFDVKRNHTYTLTAAIKGTADFQEALIGVDERVSSVGLPIAVGMFGGAIIGAGTEGDPYRFSRRLYVETTDVSAPVKWALNYGPFEKLADSETDGRANTWNVNKETGGSLTDFPAANYCFSKNITSEQVSKDALLWYLPALEQLMCIWITHNGSGASFSDIKGWSNYWPSSLLTDEIGWSVDFSNGKTFHDGNKLISKQYSVRCVKEMP